MSAHDVETVAPVKPAVRAPIVNVDKLTYAGHLASLAEVAEHPRYRFVEGDIGDRSLVRQLLADEQPDTQRTKHLRVHLSRLPDRRVLGAQSAQFHPFPGGGDGSGENQSGGLQRGDTGACPRRG